jgi:iron complex transport system permease protein
LAGATAPARPRGAVLTGRRPAAPARALWLGAGVVVLALAVLASIAFGARIVGWHDVVSGLAAVVSGDDSGGIAEAAVRVRVPRTLLAVVVGAALGLSGAVMQGITRNPLADPGILGVMTGAALAVVIGMTWFGLRSPTGYIWVAIVGAAVAATFVYAVGSLGRGGATPLKLALAGTATSAALLSLISVVLLPRVDLINQYRFWQIGGVGGATYEKTWQVLPFLVAGAAISVAAARGLNSLALGDDVAAGLGIHVGRTRVLASVGAITLCGAATAVAGPIVFVGLVVPHVCRLLIGIDHRWLLPASMIFGAALLTTADVVGRVVTRPAEIDVGIIMSIVGAPFFIYIVRRQKLRSL